MVGDAELRYVGLNQVKEWFREGENDPREDESVAESTKELS